MTSVICGLSFTASAQVAPPSTAPAEAPGDKLVTALSKPMSFTYADGPLDAALTFFSQVSDLPIKPQWVQLKTIEVTGETSLTLNVKDVAMGRALELAVESASKGKAVAFVQDGVIRVSTRHQHSLLRQVHGPGVVKLQHIVNRLDEAALKAARERMDKPIKVSLDQVKLSDAVQFIRDASGLNVFVDPATLAKAEVTLDAEVSLEVAGVAADQVALAVVRAAGVDDAELLLDPWGVMVIASADRLKALIPLAADPENNAAE